MGRPFGCSGLQLSLDQVSFMALSGKERTSGDVSEMHAHGSPGAERRDFDLLLQSSFCKYVKMLLPPAWNSTTIKRRKK